MREEETPAERYVWYSESDKIVSTRPQSDYDHKAFTSIEEWFDFIQSLVSTGYRIT